MPFVPIDVSDSDHQDFAASLDALLRERMEDEDLDVDRMADALAMSRATLYRKCDEAFAMSPKECLWTFRLQQAVHLLLVTDGTVSEIAYACGFRTVPHFTRRFREQFGRTPAAYRKTPSLITIASGVVDLDDPVGRLPGAQLKSTPQDSAGSDRTFERKSSTAEMTASWLRFGYFAYALSGIRCTRSRNLPGSTIRLCRK